MERRFELRKEALMEECQVDRSVFDDAIARLKRFVEPFADRLVRTEQKRHALTFVSGLVSDVDRKNTESIAYRHDQDRKDLQHFIGESTWDHKPLVDELVEQVGRKLGRRDGVIVFDPSGFPKKGTESVAVRRQWCGRLGKVDNCQVAVYMGYVSEVEHALVNVRLYFPKQWSKDGVRRKKCKVPRDVRFKTRHRLALDMLDEAGDRLPHAWVTGDDEMGRSTVFRRALRTRHEPYLLAVPSNTLVRDLDAPPPEYAGRGARPKTPFIRADAWREALPKSAWTKMDVRDGEKGPLVVEMTVCRVCAKTDRRRVGPEEILVVLRTRDDGGKIKYDYYLSNAPADTPPREFARVAKAEHRIEECIQRGKSETGLADYEVRTWHGWHHHQVLSMIAAWFLTCETLRGKKADARVDLAPSSTGSRLAITFGLPLRWSHAHRPRANPSPHTQPTRAILPLETT